MAIQTGVATTSEWGGLKTLFPEPLAMWPNVLPAATSNVGDLARAWLKDGNWEAAGKLPDALMDMGRDGDAREVRRAIAACACEAIGIGRKLLGTQGYVARLISAGENGRWLAMQVLWFDLFDFDDTIAKLHAAQARVM